MLMSQNLVSVQAPITSQRLVAQTLLVGVTDVCFLSFCLKYNYLQVQLHSSPKCIQYFPQSLYYQCCYFSPGHITGKLLSCPPPNQFFTQKPR